MKEAPKDTLQDDFSHLFKERLLKTLYGVCPVVTPPLPLNSYQGPLREDTLTLAPATYSHNALGILPVIRTFLPTEKRTQAETPVAGLNVPAVETIQWAELLPHIPPERRKIVTVILDPREFNAILTTEERVAQLRTALVCRRTS